MKLVYEGEVAVNGSLMKGYRYGRVGINVSHEGYRPEHDRFDMQPGDDLIVVSLVAPLGYPLPPDDKDKLLQEFGMDINKQVHSFQQSGVSIGVPIKFYVQVVAKKTPIN